MAALEKANMNAKTKHTPKVNEADAEATTEANMSANMNTTNKTSVKV